MTGMMDPGCRKCMIWDEDKQDGELLKFITQMIELRKNNPAFGSKGKIQFVEAVREDQHIMYTKTFNDEKILFILNGADHPINASLPKDLKKASCLLTGQEISGSTVELDANGLSIISYE
jgi:pullulanase/glycogen debranching enzyme